MRKLCVVCLVLRDLSEESVRVGLTPPVSGPEVQPVEDPAGGEETEEDPQTDQSPASQDNARAEDPELPAPVSPLPQTHRRDDQPSGQESQPGVQQDVPSSPALRH